MASKCIDARICCEMGVEQSTPKSVEEEIPEEPARPPSALVICGPSGVGKGTLIELLLEDSEGFGFSISHTTRKPRDTEKVHKSHVGSSQSGIWRMEWRTIL